MLSDDSKRTHRLTYNKGLNRTSNTKPPKDRLIKHRWAPIIFPCLFFPIPRYSKQYFHYVCQKQIVDTSDLRSLKKRSHLSHLRREKQLQALCVRHVLRWVNAGIFSISDNSAYNDWSKWIYSM